MGLDWNIRINGKTADQREDFHCNGMTISHYLDGCTALMVGDLDLNPYYPLWPANTKQRPTKTEIDSEDMQIIAERVSQRAECAEHIRIAAWLWSWAEQDKPDHLITLYLSY
jgi:hypothetical protein